MADQSSSPEFALLHTCRRRCRTSLFGLLPCALLILSACSVPESRAGAAGAPTTRVVDLPTRTGVTQRFVSIASPKSTIGVILFPGGNGWIDTDARGHIRRSGNFLVRSRDMFADAGLMVAVVDVPSDRRQPPYLSGFRYTREHVADIEALISWMKQHGAQAVWLVGTSRGTESAAYIAMQLADRGTGPDGLVLVSTVFTVVDMQLSKVTVPTLIVHHRRDGCGASPYRLTPDLMAKFTAVSRKELLTVDGGMNTGDPCEAFAYHGFNGIERTVVRDISNWMQAR